MIYETMKKDNITAMKAKDKVAHSLYSLVLGKMNLYVKENHLETLDDPTCSTMITKSLKELQEELDMFAKAGREENVRDLTRQMEILKSYLPKQLTEEEIKEIILTLEDKSIPSVMKYFKANYNGKADMKLVNQVAKNM